MAKHYSIEGATGGLDRCIIGPGVCEVIPPEAEKSIKSLGILKMLDGAFEAGTEERPSKRLVVQEFIDTMKKFQADQPTRVKAFVDELIAGTLHYPRAVNDTEIKRLIALHLPEFGPNGMPLPGVPAQGEGAHEAGYDQAS